MPSAGFLLDALEPALILALLGSVDSLLTALVADSLTGGRHKPDRELIAQGVGNMAAGLFGGLPGAGGTTSTVINIQAGGRTRASGALRPIVLLALLVFGFGRYVEPIPLAALADVVEAAREAGVVLQGLELRLGEGVVVGHLRAAQ